MLIERITINNFTVFKGEVDITLSSGVNVVIGENGTGKTHLLKLLYAFFEAESGFETLLTEDGIRATGVASDLSRTFPVLLVSLFPVENGKYLLNNTASQNQHEKICIFSFNEGEYDYQSDLSYISHIGEWPYFKYFYPNEDFYDLKKIPAVFIPAKDMLTHAGLEKDFAQRNLPFDITLIDILNKSGVSTLKNLPDGMKNIMGKIEGIIGGKVLFENNHYFISKENGLKVSFGAEAEGFKKLGLIYRLIETGNIANGSVLIWDEPEANINPGNIPAIADILLALQQAGVQIFIATHDYFLAKYINIRKTDRNEVLFHSLHKAGDSIKHESENDFDLLENNIITEQSIKLYKEEIAKVME